MYFLISFFLVHKIFTFCINGVLNCKCPAPGPKGLISAGMTHINVQVYTFYVFSQQIYVINFFLDFLSPSSFVPPQNVVYFLMLPLLVHKIFTFCINGVLNCKCPAARPKG